MVRKSQSQELVNIRQKMSNINPDSPVEILVCVHNGLEDVRKCLTSVLATMRTSDRLVIVDDGSDNETRLLCQKFFNDLGVERCSLLRRSEGSGFCKAANAGLKLTSFETVIVLNSDTIVVGDWIARIVTCMSSNWRIGIVGPMSNAGGWQSIPELPTQAVSSNPVRSDLSTLEEIHKECAGYSQRFCPPIVEQINGFCFAVSRDVLNSIGLFDEINFPMGYGEENDFTFRAMNADFLCAIALDCFVYHAKTASYTGEARTRLSTEGQLRLHALHGRGRVQSAVKQTQEHSTLKLIRSSARDIFSTKGWLSGQS